MADIVKIVKVIFKTDAGIKDSFECTRYEVRPDERATMLLTMYFLDADGNFVRGVHLARIVEIGAEAINQDLIKQMTDITTATVN